MPLLTYSPKFGLLGDYVTASKVRGKLSDFVSSRDIPSARPQTRMRVTPGYLASMSRRPRFATRRLGADESTLDKGLSIGGKVVDIIGGFVKNVWGGSGGTGGAGGGGSTGGSGAPTTTTTAPARAAGMDTQTLLLLGGGALILILALKK